MQEKCLIFKIGTIHFHGLNERFSFIWSLHSFCFCPACAWMRWLLTFSLHCLCSSTSQLFTSRLRLVYWSALKIANDLPIFASYYTVVIVSLTWLAYFLAHDYFSYINSLVFLNLFSVSLWRRANARNVRLTLPSVLAVHRPFYILIYIFLYFDLYLYSTSVA